MRMRVMWSFHRQLRLQRRSTYYFQNLNYNFKTNNGSSRKLGLKNNILLTSDNITICKMELHNLCLRH